MLGFHVKGVAHITRCPRTIASDAFTGTIAFDANDKFCLGGERLININGTYGADGTVYATEVDSFTRVVSRGNENGAPAYFVARTAAGERLVFGNTSDSKAMVRSCILSLVTY